MLTEGGDRSFNVRLELFKLTPLSNRPDFWRPFLLAASRSEQSAGTFRLFIDKERAVAENKTSSCPGARRSGLTLTLRAYFQNPLPPRSDVRAHPRTDNGLRFDFFRLFIFLADCDTVCAAFLNRGADFKFNAFALKVLNGVIDKLRIKSRQNRRGTRHRRSGRDFHLYHNICITPACGSQVHREIQFP